MHGANVSRRAPERRRGADEQHRGEEPRLLEDPVELQDPPLPRHRRQAADEEVEVGGEDEPVRRRLSRQRDRELKDRRHRAEHEGRLPAFGPWRTALPERVGREERERQELDQERRRAAHPHGWSRVACQAEPRNPPDARVSVRVQSARS